MRHVTPSVLLTFILCVLIGYFEPANAQGLTNLGSSTANMVAFDPNDNCPFWPNPIAPGVTITVTSADAPTGGYLVSSADGSQTPISIISAGGPMPLGVATNQWFPVDVANNLYDANSLSSSGTSATGSDTTTSDSNSLASNLNTLYGSVATGSSSTSSVPSTGSTTVGGPSSSISSPIGTGLAGVATNQWFPVDVFGNPIQASVGYVATNQWFPVDTYGNPIGAGSLGVATNQWFPVDVFPGVANLDPTAPVSPTATTVSLSPVPDGNYILVIVGQSGNTYTSNIVISSN